LQTLFAIAKCLDTDVKELLVDETTKVKTDE